MEPNIIQNGNRLTPVPTEDISLLEGNMANRDVKAFNPKGTSLLDLLAKETLIENILPQLSFTERASFAQSCKLGNDYVNSMSAASIYPGLEMELDMLAQKASIIEENYKKVAILRFLAQVSYACFGEWNKAEEINKHKGEYKYNIIKKDEIASMAAKSVVATIDSQKKINNASLLSTEELLEDFKNQFIILERDFLGTIEDYITERRAAVAIGRELAKKFFAGSQTLEAIEERWLFFRQNFIDGNQDAGQEEFRQNILTGLFPSLASTAFSLIQTKEEIRESLTNLKRIFNNYPVDRSIRDSIWVSIDRLLFKAILTNVSNKVEIKESLQFFNDIFLKEIYLQEESLIEIIPELAKIMFREAQTQEEKSACQTFLDDVFFSKFSNDWDQKKARMELEVYFYKQNPIFADILEKVRFLSGKTITREDGSTFVYQGNPKALAELLA